MLNKLFFSLLLTMSALYAGEIKIIDSYVRAVPPNVPNSAAFMQIQNLADRPLTLLSVTSDEAKNVELHEHVMDGQMMKMQQVHAIPLLPKTTTSLKPGGYHIMLLGLNHPLKEGTFVSLLLHFSNNETVAIEAPVTSVMSGMKMQKNHPGMQP